MGLPAECGLLCGPEYKLKNYATKLLAFPYTEKLLKINKQLMGLGSRGELSQGAHAVTAEDVVRPPRSISSSGHF